MKPRHALPSLVLSTALALALVPALARAQRDYGALPEPDITFREMDFAQLDLAVPPPPLTPAPVTAPGERPTPGVSLPATPRNATPAPAPAPGSIRLNFQNAALNDVLNSLSAAAGFIIVQQQPVSGTINLVSQQPVSPDEAIDALNAALYDKGYAVLRNARILKIVPREGAERLNLPVVTGSTPDNIPRKDNLVTQIMPVRYVEVGKLVDTLRPLLSANATISSNDNANAVLLTDTQANIHRIAEIVHALDSSISSLSVIRVFTLRYADAKSLADVITQLFTPAGQSGGNNNNQRGGFGGGFPFFGGGGGGRGGGNQGGGATQPTSEARQAAVHVIAVADETTNSVVVSAPDESMTEVANIVERLDNNTTEVTETQIFKLLHADATETAATITTLYSDLSNSSTAGGGNNRNGQQGGANNRFPGQPGQQTASTARSDRELLQARVVAVADPRTNSVLVNASRATMAQIALTMGRLDASESKKQHVYVVTLGHADPDNVATILRGMYSVSTTSAGSTTATQPSTSRLTGRTQTGVTSEFSSDLNSSSGTSGSRSSTGLR